MKEAACEELREILADAEQSGVSNSTVDNVFARVKERLQMDGTLPTSG